LYKLVRSCKHSSIYLYEYVLPPLILHAMRKIARLMESFAKNSYAILMGHPFEQLVGYNLAFTKKASCCGQTLAATGHFNLV